MTDGAARRHDPRRGRAGFGPVADVFREQLRGARGPRRRVRRLRARVARSSTCGAGLPTARTGRPWDAGHGGRHLLLLEGHPRDLRIPARAAGPPRSRCAGRTLLAGVRRSTARTTSRCAGCSATAPACPRSTATSVLDEVLAWDPVIRRSRRRPRSGDRGTAHSYHAMTYGWLIGEVIRRITGLSPGRVLPRSWRSARPPDLDRRPGLGACLGAWMEPPLPDADHGGGAGNCDRAANPWPSAPVDGRGIRVPLTRAVTFNDPGIQRAEIPAANGIGTARSLGSVCRVRVRHGRRMLLPSRSRITRS